jgi:hypothetical protein
MFQFHHLRPSSAPRNVMMLLIAGDAPPPAAAADARAVGLWSAGSTALEPRGRRSGGGARAPRRPELVLADEPSAISMAVGGALHELW